MIKKIYETTEFIIYKDSKGYDFAYDIENKIDNMIIIKFTNFDEELKIKDWIGLFNNQSYMIEDILNGDYELIEEVR